MFKVIFTLDYEIHGNGDGDPYKMMIEPTYRLMDFLEKYGAKLTIFADVAEILKFKDFYLKYGKDKYYSIAIEEQLKYAISRGHDVQLHIHSSYFNSNYENGKWIQDYDEFSLASLEYEKINYYVNLSKSYLEKLLRQVNSEYSCIAYRAAGWDMQPSKNIIKALTNNGIFIDSSVWRNGVYKSHVEFDYTNSHHTLLPWFADKNEICTINRSSKLLEVPIYCEDKRIWAFITPIRLLRTLRSQIHKQSNNLNEKRVNPKSNYLHYFNKFYKLFYKKFPWKLDINYPFGYQLINTVKKLEKKYINHYKEIPLIVSGHSKSFTRMNKYYVKSFLKFLSKNNNIYKFATYKDLDIEYYRNIKYH